MTAIGSKTVNPLSGLSWPSFGLTKQRNLVDALIDFATHLKGWQLTLLFVAYFALVVAVDFISGDELALSLLYIPVIGFVTVRVSLKVALNLSLICALIWLIDDIFVQATSSPTHAEIVATLVHFCCFSVIATLICRLNTALKRERFLSRHDFLTGLPNMHSFNDRAEEELRKSTSEESLFSIVFVDCDNFKTVNDTLGHQAGDDLLKTVSDQLMASLRSEDYVARYGGDEFVLLLPNTDSETAVEVLTRLQNELNNEMQKNGWPVTLSMGVATFLRPPESVESAIKTADRIMYERKQTSKNGVSAQVFGNETNQLVDA